MNIFEINKLKNYLRMHNSQFLKSFSNTKNAPFPNGLLEQQNLNGEFKKHFEISFCENWYSFNQFIFYDGNAKMLTNEQEIALSNLLFQTYVKTNYIDSVAILNPVSFHIVPNKLDSINNLKIYFDGYISSPSEEVFILFLFKGGYVSNLNERLHIALYKLKLYQSVNHKKVQLRLVFVDFDHNNLCKAPFIVDNELNVLFLPAIQSKLLKFDTINVFESEITFKLNSILSKND
ncbi:hypothetical protein [Flavobacterium sp.]|uniref:hypothetical protein n=1 Tax=Flavobacterium sp. TaxID=239 RepID=UPI0037C1169B